MAKRTRAVTRSDVARRANVSEGAVSQVLNNTPSARISDETRERIRKAADELGYRPSAAAKAISTGRTGLISALMCNSAELFDPYTMEVVRGIWSGLTARSLRLIIGGLADNKDASVDFRERMADGILLMSVVEEIKGVDRMVQAGFPLVSVGNDVSPDVDRADLDNRAAGRMATERLIEAGHRDIVHISGPLETMANARERLAGYRDALLDNGLPYRQEMVVEGLFWSSRRKNLTPPIEPFLDRGLPFTAIFTGCDVVALETAEVLKERGMSVPDDVSLVGIDGWHPMVGRKLLSTIRQPVSDIGAAAIRMLLDRLDGYDGPGRKVFLQGKSIEGETIKAI